MSTSGIHQTGVDGVITEFGFGLLAQRGDECYPVGTAVLLAPHLALTARHVVDELWRYFGDEYKLKFGKLDGSFVLFGLQVLPDKSGWFGNYGDLLIPT